MFSENYHFGNADHVKQVLDSRRRDLLLLLSVTYAHNDAYAKCGGLLQKIKRLQQLQRVNGHPDGAKWIAELKGEYDSLRAERDRCRQVIAQAARYYGLVIQRYANARIMGYTRRVTRGADGKRYRPQGQIVGLTQKSLFVFSKLWEQEGRPNLVNDHMLGDHR